MNSSTVTMAARMITAFLPHTLSQANTKANSRARTNRPSTTIAGIQINRSKAATPLLGT